MEKDLILEDAISLKASEYNLAKVDLSIPERPELSITWRYPKYPQAPVLPSQGFKIHISATIFNSENIFDSVVPYLISNEIEFKVIGSNVLLRQLNANLYGYRQVGKFITVYPVVLNK